MAGSARTVLVPNGLKWPNALAIDHGSETLYWTDANMKLIEMLHLESVSSLETGIIIPMGDVIQTL